MEGVDCAGYGEEEIQVFQEGKEDEEEENQEWNDRSFDLTPDKPVQCKNPK